MGGYQDRHGVGTGVTSSGELTMCTSALGA